MPLPSTRVIHARYAAHHRPTVAGTFNAECVITMPPAAAGTWSSTTGAVTETDAVVLFEGPCRIQAEPATTGQADAAGQSVTARRYDVQLDCDVDIPAGEDGALLTITTCEQDLLLAGRGMRVVELQVGSVRWARFLTVRDDLSN